MDTKSVILLLALPLAALSINIGSKLDFGDQSPGIVPESAKYPGEKKEPSVAPGVVKATLEVNLGTLTSGNQESKPDKKNKKKKKNQVLICNLEGDCKLHDVPAGKGKEYEDDEDDEEKKPLKPVIVTDFDEDPSINGEDDVNVTDGKKVPDVPVVVGHRGAVKDDGFPYHTGQGHRNIDRLPVYYGMKLSPAFHQPYPGPIIYEEEPHYPPLHHGSYPSYPAIHEVGYLYSRLDHYPLTDYPDYTGSKQHYPDHTASNPSYHDYFSGQGPKTPTLYDKYFPSGNPDITSLHRRVGGGGSVGSNRPGVYWPSTEVPRPGGSGWVGSNRPGIYTPPQRPEYVPVVVSVKGKMDLDKLTGSGKDKETHNPKPGGSEISVDGKLGEPLDKTESE